ncbi:MAG: hypothetical protein HDR22_10025 [Lachnospiraceae bacterium]|nr:hypothetical protein [Lachnospiraceae bacterium]
MDFYRDIRYLDYQDGENSRENVGSVKLFFRGNAGKAEIYIKKIPCLYPIECKLAVSRQGAVSYTRWVEIDRTDWRKDFAFSWDQPYDNVEVELLMSKERKICVKKKELDTKQELTALYEEKHPVRMQQISRDEIEYVPMRNDRNKEEHPDTKEMPQDRLAEKGKEAPGSSGQKTIKLAGRENEYYMSRLSELGELSKDLEPLEHNSFLLHGYFNYRHLLIRKEGERFLVGVPGNYYYREEMVAAMFGFPNFVPAKREDSVLEGEKTVGEFGYYFE